MYLAEDGRDEQRAVEPLRSARARVGVGGELCREGADPEAARLVHAVGERVVERQQAVAQL